LALPERADLHRAAIHLTASVASFLTRSATASLPASLFLQKTANTANRANGAFGPSPQPCENGSTYSNQTKDQFLELRAVQLEALQYR
jgi:hypothetical protein